MTGSGPRKRRGRTKAWLYLALFGADAGDEGGSDDATDDAGVESTQRGGR
jgi:hypothetical protein